MDKFEKKDLTKKSENLSRWYTDVILKAKLADYSPVKGCMVIRPYGYALWENIKNPLDQMIKNARVENAYFPIFIPESFLKKEKKHIEGFTPELAVVTIGGGKKLSENLVVRPTSETVMYSMFAKWIKSYRDLPLKINQWCNIVRWEKRTYLFLRTTEFLWQEGHTAHATHKEAIEEVNRALDAYIKTCQEWVALPGIAGQKSQFDKFPGAVNTLAYEALMPDGKALQLCTSHDLGQNFAKPFEVQFQDKEGKLQYVWQTSWGFTTRIIGALLMAHGDDNGLVMPPKIAPIQVAIVPIWGKKDKKISQKVTTIKNQLKKVGIRVKVFDQEEQTPGWKFNQVELLGIPIQMVIGPQEVSKNSVTLKRRDSQEKWQATIANLEKKIKEVLDKIQKNLYLRAQKFVKENTHEVSNYEDFKIVMSSKRGFIKAFWCEQSSCEEKIKQETKASTRCLPRGVKKENGKCVHCGKPASYRWIFAQAY